MTDKLDDADRINRTWGGILEYKQTMNKSVIGKLLLVGVLSYMQLGCGSEKQKLPHVEKVTLTVNAVASAGGAISPASTTVTKGGTTTFTITPNSGYTIDNISGCAGSLSGTTYTTGAINENCTVTANFKINSYTVTTTVGSGGQVNPTSIMVEHGKTASFTITPDLGFAIESVTGCGGSLVDKVYNTAAVVAACAIDVKFKQVSQQLNLAVYLGAINGGKAEVKYIPNNLIESLVLDQNGKANLTVTDLSQTNFQVNAFGLTGNAVTIADNSIQVDCSFSKPCIVSPWQQLRQQLASIYSGTEQDKFNQADQLLMTVLGLKSIADPFVAFNNNQTIEGIDINALVALLQTSLTSTQFSVALIGDIQDGAIDDAAWLNYFKNAKVKAPQPLAHTDSAIKAVLAEREALSPGKTFTITSLGEAANKTQHFADVVMMESESYVYVDADGNEKTAAITNPLYYGFNLGRWNGQLDAETSLLRQIFISDLSLFLLPDAEKIKLAEELVVNEAFKQAAALIESNVKNDETRVYNQAVLNQIAELTDQIQQEMESAQVKQLSMLSTFYLNKPNKVPVPVLNKANTNSKIQAAAPDKPLVLIPEVLEGEITHGGSENNVLMDVINHTSVYYAMNKESDMKGFNYFWKGRALQPSYGVGFITTKRGAGWLWGELGDKTPTDISDYKKDNFVFYNKSVDGRIVTIPNIYNTLNLFQALAGGFTDSKIIKMLDSTIQNLQSVKYVKKFQQGTETVFSVFDAAFSSLQFGCELFDFGVEVSARENNTSFQGFDSLVGFDFCIGVGRARELFDATKSILDSINYNVNLTEPDFIKDSPYNSRDLTKQKFKKEINQLRTGGLTTVFKKTNKEKRNSFIDLDLDANAARVYLLQLTIEFCTNPEDSEHGKFFVGKSIGDGTKLKVRTKDIAQYAIYKNNKKYRTFISNRVVFGLYNPFYNKKHGTPEKYLKDGYALFKKEHGKAYFKCLSEDVFGDGFVVKATNLMDLLGKMAKALAGQDADISLTQAGTWLTLGVKLVEEGAGGLTNIISEMAAKQAATLALGPYGIAIKLAETGNSAGAIAFDLLDKPSEVRIKFERVNGEMQPTIAFPSLDQISYLAFSEQTAGSNENNKGVLYTHRVPALGSNVRNGGDSAEFRTGYLLAKDNLVNHLLITSHTEFSYKNQLLFDAKSTAFESWLKTAQESAHFTWQVKHCSIADITCVTSSKPTSEWPIFPGNDLRFSLSADELDDDLQKYKRLEGLISKTDNLYNPILWEYAAKAKSQPLDEIAYVDFTKAYERKVSLGKVQHKTPGFYFDTTSAILGSHTYNTGVHVYVTLDYGYQTANAKSHNALLKEQSYLLENDKHINQQGVTGKQTKLVLRLNRPENNFNYFCNADAMLDSCINQAGFVVWGQAGNQSSWQRLTEVELGKGNQDLLLPAGITRVVLLDAVTTAYLNNTAISPSHYIYTRLQQYQQGLVHLPFLTVAIADLTLFRVDAAASAFLDLDDEAKTLKAELSAAPTIAQANWYLVQGNACQETIQDIPLPAGLKVNQLEVNYAFSASRVRGDAPLIRPFPPVASNCPVERLVASGTVANLTASLTELWSKTVNADGDYYLILAAPNNQSNGQLMYWRSNIVTQLPPLPVELISGCDGTGACELLLNFDEVAAQNAGYRFAININGVVYELTLQELANFGNEFFTANLTRNADGRLVLSLQLKNAGNYELQVQVTANADTFVLYNTQSVHVPKPTVKASITSLALQWADLKASNYRVYISSQQGFDPSKVETYPDGQSFFTTDLNQQIDNLTTGKTYYLRLEAVVENNSYFSAEAQATPAQVVTASGKLNDTGIDWCANAGSNNLACPVAGFAGQDGEHGRDALAREGKLQKVGGGAAGFDFTKLDANGNDLPASASAWSCVRDNHTGLIWEVKTTDGGLRDMNHTYTWYNPDSSTNGGSPGTQNGGQCTGSGCDTHAFVQAVNSQSLCGANDWRMPTRKELLGLVHNGRFYPAIDTAYFQNSPSGWFWSSSPNANDSSGAWSVNFDAGNFHGLNKNRNFRVRLVRAGQ